MPWHLSSMLIIWSAAHHFYISDHFTLPFCISHSPSYSCALSNIYTPIYPSILFHFLAIFYSPASTFTSFSHFNLYFCASDRGIHLGEVVMQNFRNKLTENQSQQQRQSWSFTLVWNQWALYFSKSTSQTSGCFFYKMQ